MIQITPQTLTTAPINWELLPEVFRRQKDNLALYQEFYNEMPKVKESADKLIKEIIRTHNQPAQKKTPPKKQAKGKAPITKRKAPAPPKKKTPAPRKTKKVAAKAKKPKKAVKAKVKTKIKVIKEKAPKALVNVKKYSLELQLIKSFIAMKGKDRKVTSIRNFLKRIESAKTNTNVPPQKSILSTIAQRMKTALAGLAGNVELIRNINIADDLLKQCKEAVKNAKPRLQVQYLSGLKPKK
ncbi:MAG: hypothetical protein F9K23_16365 [Bacteroidetes bacterium]|nr:MAG: hypothetical protein F9K23_16365 [Bacteroidota bacterium]